MKKIFLILALFLGLVLNIKQVWASGFAITSIGEVSTNGKYYSKFWHTSLAPTIRGVALPGADILVDIDGTQVQIAADSSGDWVYTPPVQTDGDRVFTFTSNGSTIKTTITLGKTNVDWSKAIGGDDATTNLPSVGNPWPTAVLLLAGMGFVVGAVKIKRMT